jgi:hypothetical protein
LESEITDGSKLDPKIQDQIIHITKDISYATNRTLNAMKYFFHWEHMGENLISSKGKYWSRDGIDWYTIPIILEVTVEVRSPFNLTENTSKYIQNYLNGDGWEPFLGLRHLYKAKNESDPRFKWIDATIAAELAIKEFYIRLVPQLETLLLEIPSPPLVKLYGPVMESFIKVRSPKLREIGKGVEIRNKLLHRPTIINIEANEAIKYVEDIEYAIYHLLSILYTDQDFVIKHKLIPNIEIIRE